MCSLQKICSYQFNRNWKYYIWKIDANINGPIADLYASYHEQVLYNCGKILNIAVFTDDVNGNGQ